MQTRTIVMLTKGTLGDLVPLLAIGEGLRARGHYVILLSHCDYRVLAEACDIKFIPLDSPHERAMFLSDIYLLNSVGGSVSFFNRYCKPRIKREYYLMIEAMNGVNGNGLLLTRHMATLADLLVADRIKCPLVRLFTTPVQAAMFGFLGPLFGKLFISALNPVCTALGHQLVTEIDTFLQLPAANLGTWPSWFQKKEERPKIKVIPIGFVTHDRQESGVAPANVEAILNGSRAPVLIYTSTAEILRADFLSIAVEACANLGMPAIVVSGADAIAARSFPGNVVTCSRLPFASVLPKCSVIVHHGGLGTIARSIASGLPQLIMPYGAERPHSASIVVDLGVGKSIERAGWSARAVSDALVQLTASEAIRTRCTSFSLVARNDSPFENVERIIDEVLRTRQ